MSFVVAIDGPAGSGKGTVAKMVGDKIGLINIDTGATYRAVALEVLNQKISLEETQKMIDLVDDIKIELTKEENRELVWLNGKDVTEKIRSKDVTKIVSQVSSITKIRLKMVELQRKLAEGKDVIMEGRDITTYVFPHADVKIYLDATIEVRVNRRFKENQEKGIKMSYQEVYDNIQARDENDKSKEIGSLKIAKDAIYIDTTTLSIDNVTKQVINIIEDRRRKL